MLHIGLYKIVVMGMKLLRQLLQFYLDLKIIWKLSLGFGLILLAVFGMVLVGNVSVAESKKTLNQVIQGQLEPLVYLNDIRSYIAELEVGVRDALLQQDDVGWNYIRNQFLPLTVLKTVDYSFEQLVNTAGNPQERKQLLELQNHWRQYYRHYQTLLKDKRLYQEKTFHQETNQLRYFLVGGIDRLVEEYYRQQAILTKTRADETAQKLENITRMIIILTVVLAFGVGFLTTWAIVNPLTRMAQVARKIAAGELSSELVVKRRDEFGVVMECFNTMVAELGFLVDQIKAAAEKVHENSKKLLDDSLSVTTVTQQLMNTMTQVSAGAELQQQKVSSVHQVIGNITEFSQLVNQVTAQVEQLSELSVTKALQGETAAGEVSHRISRVQNFMADSAKSVEQLQQLSAEVTNMFLMVQDIAEQSNLLSLNAAIEAARAGASGRGFGVVAAAIGQMADKTRETAGQAQELVAKIQEMFISLSQMMKTENAVMAEGEKAVASLGEVFASIIETAQQVNSQLGMVTKQTSDLSREHHEVLKAVEQIAAIADEHKSGTEHAAAAATEHFGSTQEIIGCSQILAHWGDNLRLAVDKFKLNRTATERSPM